MALFYRSLQKKFLTYQSRTNVAPSYHRITVLSYNFQQRWRIDPILIALMFLSRHNWSPREKKILQSKNKTYTYVMYYISNRKMIKIIGHFVPYWNFFKHLRLQWYSMSGIRMQHTRSQLFLKNSAAVCYLNKNERNYPMNFWENQTALEVIWISFRNWEKKGNSDRNSRRTLQFLKEIRITPKAVFFLRLEFWKKLYGKVIWSQPDQQTT